MPYTVAPTALPEVLIQEAKVLGDGRGFFYQSVNQRDFQRAPGLTVNFAQDNHSKSSQWVLSGMLYQIQYSQGKLARMTQGAVSDVAVNLRRSSPNFSKWVGVMLSADNKRQLWILRDLLMALWSPARLPSSCIKRQTIGIPNMNAEYFLQHRLSVFSGLCKWSQRLRTKMQ